MRCTVAAPPLVRVATWLTHLELDWQSPVWRHWLDRLGEVHTVVRYDKRGCGLSDMGDAEPSVETWVGDLEAVVDAAGLERFALLGVSQGAAIAVVYALRHPSRVSSCCTAVMRGQPEQEGGLVAAIRAGWSSVEPAFRHVFSMLSCHMEAASSCPGTTTCCARRLRPRRRYARSRRGGRSTSYRTRARCKRERS
jgi:pimeloyl-ACP methyl ester carboxylesterase